MNRNAKIFLAILIPMFLIVVSFFYFKSVKYNISELTADNISVLTHIKNENIDRNSGINHFYRDYANFEADFQLLSPDYKYYSFNKEAGYTDIYDNINEYRYLVSYKNGNRWHISIVKQFGYTPGFLFGAEEIIQKLLKEYGYTYLKTNVKDGVDRIIKEYSDFFLIGNVYRNEADEITGVKFLTYGRNKYFKSE